MSASPKPPPKSLNPFLKLALELGPLVAFFVAYGKLGIFTATGVFMAATVVALAISYAVLRTVPIVLLVSGVLVLVFGGLTVWLANDTFIKLKPTILYLCFAAALAFGLATRQMFIKIILEFAFQLTERGWVLLTRAWIGFFLALAVLNEAVWRNFSTDTWVKFKVFGVMPLTVLFSFAMMPLVMKHMLPESTDKR